eukprot:TRINITY_DN78233_c0_g1_i1.p1 TRINITY_DN78233_c0_g1~~TRINITY_DN78233_c0_g1_i1.p1  ORF type:complete len:195 (+),score=33.85 TRINITY_DN78233_c0_g1_i1:84-668(+)
MATIKIQNGMPGLVLELKDPLSNAGQFDNPNGQFGDKLTDGQEADLTISAYFPARQVFSLGLHSANLTHTAISLAASIDGREYTVILAEHTYQGGFSNNQAGVVIRMGEAYADEKGNIDPTSHGVSATGAVSDWDAVCYHEHKTAQKYAIFDERTTKFMVTCFLHNSTKGTIVFRFDAVGTPLSTRQKAAGISQ